MRRVVIRGGPGSGHFGHEGRPGQVGGSQPGDFHSEEPARNERINASYIEDRLGFSPTADDVVGVESKFPVKGISASDLDMSDINQAEFWLGPNGQLYPMFGDVRHADAARDAMSDWYGTQEKRIAPMLSLGPSKMRPDWTSLFYRQTIDFMGDKRSAFHPIAIGSPWPGSESLRWAQESGEVLGFLSKEDSTKPSTVYGLGKNFLFEGLLREAGYDPEYLLAAHGFVRVSRGGTRGSKAVGLTWDATIPPTESQRRVIMDVVNQSVEDGGTIVYEAVNATNSIPGTEGVITAEEWPSQRRAFVAGLRGDYKQANIVRSLPDWVLTLMIRGGPGSGHFGHAGRPGEVGGSAPGDFHSSPVDYPEWVDSDEMKKKVAEGLAKAVAKWVTHGNVVGRGNASSNFSGRGWMAHDGTLYLAPTEHLTLANMALRSATSGTPKDWGNAEMVLKRMGFGRMVITSDEFYYNGPDKVMPEQGETINALLATRRESVFAETPNHAGATRPGKEGDDREYLDKMVDAAYRLVGRSRPLVERGGAGSGHFKHEGREGERGGSSPGDRLPKDRGEQMKQAKQDFQSEPPKKREPVGAVASHIGVGYRVNLTAEAFSKYRPAVSAALEWAAREFKRVFGGQVEGVTIHDDPVAFVEANIPEMYAESMAKLGEKDKREVEAGIREDHSRLRAAYNPLTKQVLVNVGKHIEPGGALDTEGVMASATHEFVHWATFGSGRDEIWKEVKVPRAFKDIFRPRYGESLIKQEYVARVVSSEMRGSDMLTMPGDTEALAMSEQDHKNARILMDKISNSFVAPNLEMPTTLRVSPEQLVDVTVPDGLGNFWGRAVPESELDALPEGSTINAIYTMLKGQEAFEEGRTIHPDILSLNWLDETDPARHPVRAQITKKPRLDDVTMAVRSQDNVLERVLDTIGGALRELMGMKHG